MIPQQRDHRRAAGADRIAVAGTDDAVAGVDAHDRRFLRGERLDRVGANFRNKIDLQDFDALDLGHGFPFSVGKAWQPPCRQTYSISIPRGHDTGNGRGAGVVAWTTKSISSSGRGSQYIEHHPEDWIAFVLFWALGSHRLPAVLHALRPQRQPGLDRGDRALRPDVGGLHRRRRGDAQESHIASRAAVNRHGPGPLRAVLLAFVDVVKLGFIGLLAYFSVTITERMQTSSA